MPAEERHMWKQGWASKYMLTAASLLAIPGKFEKIVTEQGIIIKDEGHSRPFNDFSKLDNLDRADMVKWLARCGFTVNNSEIAFLWAVKFISLYARENADDIRTHIQNKQKDLPPMTGLMPSFYPLPSNADFDLTTLPCTALPPQS